MRGIPLWRPRVGPVVSVSVFDDLEESFLLDAPRIARCAIRLAILRGKNGICHVRDIVCGPPGILDSMPDHLEVKLVESGLPGP